MSRVLRTQPEANLESGSDAKAALSREESTDAKVDSTIEVETETFDNLVSLLPDGHVSLMKIDVEGHELAVLEGAAETLGRQGIDVLYIEAGMDRDNPQQTWYRDIEDALALHGYRLFRIYEQKQDWIEDRPVLRRVNMAFFSPRMIERHPVRLTKEMADLHNKIEVLQTQLAQKQALNEATEARLAKAERDSAEALESIKMEQDDAIVKAKRAHEEAIETIKMERDEAIAEAERANVEAIEAVEMERDEAIAEAERAHAEAIETIKMERDEAIAEVELAYAKEIETVKVERDLAISEAAAATKAREKDAVKHANAIETAKVERDLAISEAVAKARNKAAAEQSKAIEAVKKQRDRALSEAVATARDKAAAEKAKSEKEWFKELNEVTYRIAAIEASTSWKLTAPLRRIVERLRHR
ncbi:methyltransferase FkbM family protein [Roseivivax marinus]|uniref:Methyltransferase FkbM family protein n=2 Tax=Roseivivax marinus TaxID=1379903 RepID=W4HE22_9RHOB|nr:methyltransferase FkbM family protein [Roseivivax marinus]